MDQSAGCRNPIDFNLKLLDILDYVGDSVRPIREGSAVYDAKHVVCIGYTTRTDEEFCLKDYVTQSSHPGNIPHEISLKITSSVSGWILCCSCKAGTGRCKHIVACLLHLNRSDQVEYLSCTDTKQAWGILKSEKGTPWGAKKVSELCCIKTPTRLVPSDPNLRDEIVKESFTRILEVSKSSAVFKHRAGRVSNTPTLHPIRAFQSNPSSKVYCSREDLNILLQRFSEISVELVNIHNRKEKEYFETNVQVDIGNVIDIAIETQDQNTNLWKIQRSFRITASSCYKLYTYLKNSNPNWEKKITQYWNMSNIKTNGMKYGSQTENIAYECYRRKRNLMIKKIGFIIKYDEPWFGASPDGIDPTGEIILEIKCPVVGEHGGIAEIVQCNNVKKYLKQDSEASVLKLNPKHAYYAQVQMNMWVTNTKLCDFILCSSKDDDFIVVEVSSDPPFVENIVNGLKGLYFSEMLPRLIRRQNDR